MICSFAISRLYTDNGILVFNDSSFPIFFFSLFIWIRRFSLVFDLNDALKFGKEYLDFDHSIPPEFELFFVDADLVADLDLVVDPVLVDVMDLVFI